LTVLGGQSHIHRGCLRAARSACAWSPQARPSGQRGYTRMGSAPPLVDGDLVHLRQGQHRPQGHERSGAVPEHEARTGRSQEGLDILAFSGHRVPVAGRPAKFTSAPIHHIDRELIGECFRQAHVVLGCQEAGAQEDHTGAAAEFAVADRRAVRGGECACRVWWCRSAQRSAPFDSWCDARLEVRAEVRV